MLLELLVIFLILFYAYSRAPSSPKFDIIDQKIRMLESMLNRICDQLMISPNFVFGNGDRWDLKFKIVVSETKTWVYNKQIIHLLIWNPVTNAPYDDHTLVSATIHEMAHILCPEVNNETHTELFDAIELELLAIAEQLGYWQPINSIDPSYPCDP